MNCAICGKDNQPGTRFCVHCGAALAAASAPPPAAAAAAPRPAAPPSGSGGATSTSPRPVMTPVAAEPTIVRSAAPAGSIPVYDAEPKKGGGRIVALIGLAAIVIAGGYIGYKIFGGSLDVRDSLARFDTPAPAKVEPPPLPPVQTAPPADAAPPSPAAADAPKAAEDKSAAPKGAEQKSGAAPADPTKAPPPPPKSDAKAAAKTAVGPPAPAVPTLPPSTASPAPGTRPAAPAPAAAPAAAPVVDRWVQFADDLRQCQRENLFNRIICDQRVRLRYCDGYWGKVSQCPGAIANPDKGQ